MDNDFSSINKLEGERFSKSHIRIMLIAGMGFFTDAYDLFIIGIVLLMIKPIFNLSATQIGLVASAALFGAVIGPVIFGSIGDRFGRRPVYWITIVILIIGA
ncbi:MAG: MFS transporter, partial [Candidatus Marsarchaeota archaeon]|nr:MFS transporter [Candidatus Marsarchaeota archaeon]